MMIKMKVMEDNLNLNNAKLMVKNDHLLDAMTAMRKKSLGSSNSPCPSSKERKIPTHTCLGSSRLIRYSASTTSPKQRKLPWHHLSLKDMQMFGGKRSTRSVRRK